ncbi:hypothetical protein RD110_08060 [Rhodoferax koreense]|uniref:Uncharacterized protein n=1 Tax=Rhodoferax koreensis TaxID=1842727 RepID=A0A1P8JTS2_9BURK|nr:hypothetical protein [Rhodoferax koreense]APW37157.1 hypothetical protein RD110_08060 [Rhodoferax koreense]
MLFLIVKDPATQVPKELTVDEAQAFEDQGHGVLVVIGEGETQPLKAWRATQEQVAADLAQPEPEEAGPADGDAPEAVTETPQEPAAVAAPAKTAAKKKSTSK